MEQSLLLATHQRDITRHCELAQAHNAGVEIQVYGYEPDLLDNGWRELLRQQRAVLRGFTGELAMHGAFYDLAPASLDGRVSALARERCLQSLEIAMELGARHIVFHTGFIPAVPNSSYRAGWAGRQVAFWSRILEDTTLRDLTIVLENMWEPAPDIIMDVLEQVNSPHLAACLDVAHTSLYGRDAALKDWVARVAPRLAHCHLNNHHGRYDDHLPLDMDDGAIHYRDDVLPLFAAMPSTVWLVLEMGPLDHLERSLRFLGR